MGQNYRLSLKNIGKLVKGRNLPYTFLRGQPLKRTSVQKSNKNEILLARVKNSNCLKFCTQVEPSKTRKTVFFFPQICFYFREKRTFYFHPLESIDRVMTGRKLNAFARLAFQRYFIKGNLTNVCSFIESSSSVKCRRLKTLLVSRIRILSFCPFFNFLYVLTRAF